MPTERKSNIVLSNPSTTALPGRRAPAGPPPEAQPRIVLSFDVEEHFRIEAAAGLEVAPALQAHHADRVEVATRWLLDQLHEHDIKATFFVVGLLARQHKALVRDMARAGHEVASHSWKHSRIHRLSPESFREDVRNSKDILEQITGQPVRGYRAPTFSIVAETAWALDVLAEEGMLYDSSIYPVRHDRYGVPAAPRAPFLARGREHTILELPPATLRCLGTNLPMGGGGYFRLFPLAFTRWAVRQTLHTCSPPVATLYFHPWEFDPGQQRLPLGRLSTFRTYVGITRSRQRLLVLLEACCFARALDVAKRLADQGEGLPSFALFASGKEGQSMRPTLGRTNP